MNVDALFEQFEQKKILVLGDVMIDAYLYGSVTRLSPEAPVPIINLRKKEDRLGGAANVALNLRSLGAQATICAVVGNDAGADTLRLLMEALELDTQGLVSSENRMTTVKTRVIGNHQQMLRIDEEISTAITEAEEDALLARLDQLMTREFDALILEDYNKGVLTERVIREAIRMANARGILSAVDPKKDNFLSYEGVSLFKPNLKELKEGLKLDFDFVDSRAHFEAAIDQLEAKLSNAISFVTLSEHGVFVKQGAQKEYIPAHVRNIADVSGAGDTVISVATLCLVSGLDAVMASRIANLAGGLVCEMVGVVPIDKHCLREEIRKEIIE
jgi:rfaE bifunctional protein kinase chain/domain